MRAWVVLVTGSLKENTSFNYYKKIIILSNSYFGANITIARFIMALFNCGALYHGAFVLGALNEYDRKVWHYMDLKWFI